MKGEGVIDPAVINQIEFYNRVIINGDIGENLDEICD